ncbi:hypothetical protein AB0L13_32100 [Saccharopolyspora shandongensis]|uniref:hypothetical protein n=1 Tax=Saccharopolyspora shandongensis TaxID=418495 RepID=UPI00344711FE
MAKPPGEYDAFMSYSHALDGELAPTLQRELERFAKPWYRMRALRVFRDNASLSANPGLWSSIESALEASRWFVLMASPEAATSPWVAREVAWWLDNRSPDRVLVVVTSGEFAWDEATQDVDRLRSTAVPPTLIGAFREEPRWVNLRWVRAPEQADRADPRMRECVADIAAAIRGIPKDQVIGEHVRRHRSTMRIARAAVTTMAVLLVLALVAAGIAMVQRDTAIANQLTTTANQLRDADPSLAAQLDVLSNEMHPTPDGYGNLIKGLDLPLGTALPDEAQWADDWSFHSAVWSPDGKLLATAGSNLPGDGQGELMPASGGSVRLWDVDDRARPVLLAPPLPMVSVPSMVWSPDGNTLAALERTPGAVLLRLWDLSDPTRPTALPNPLRIAERPSSAAWSPDGNILVTVEDQSFRLWDVSVPAQPRPLRLVQPPSGFIIESVRSVVRNQNRLILTTVESRADSRLAERVRLWDISDPARPSPVGEPLAFTGSVSSAEWSPDGNVLATVEDESFQLWDMSDPAHPVALPQAPEFTDGIDSVSWSPNEHVLATAEGLQVRLWDVTDRAHPVLLSRPLPARASDAVTWSPDGRTLVTEGPAEGVSTGGVRLWNIPATVFAAGDATSVQWSSDGKTLVTRSRYGQVRLWDVSGRSLRVPRGQHLTDSEVNSVAWSPNRPFLATGENGIWRLWDVSDPARPLPLAERSQGSGATNSMKWSPDGNTLALAESGFEGGLQLWDVSDPAHPVPLAQPAAFTSGFLDVEWSPDGNALAVGNSKAGTVQLWDVSSPDHPVPSGLINPNFGIYGMAWSPEGQTLIVNGYDEAHSWDVSDWSRPVPLSQPADFTRAAASVLWSPDGYTLATLDMNRSLRLWDASDWSRPVPLSQPLATKAEHGGMVAWSPDGRTLAVSGGDMLVRLWDMDAETAVRRICSATGNILTPEQWQRYVPQLSYDPPCP